MFVGNPFCVASFLTHKRSPAAASSMPIKDIFSARSTTLHPTTIEKMGVWVAVIISGSVRWYKRSSASVGRSYTRSMTNRCEYRLNESIASPVSMMWLKWFCDCSEGRWKAEGSDSCSEITQHQFAGCFCKGV